MKGETYPSPVEPGWSPADIAESLVTMGFRSVPFLLFLLVVPLVAEEATLEAICLPLLRTDWRSTPSMGRGKGKGEERTGGNR